MPRAGSRLERLLPTSSAASVDTRATSRLNLDLAEHREKTLKVLHLTLETAKGLGEPQGAEVLNEGYARFTQKDGRVTGRLLWTHGL